MYYDPVPPSRLNVGDLVVYRDASNKFTKFGTVTATKTMYFVQTITIDGELQIATEQVRKAFNKL